MKLTLLILLFLANQLIVFGQSEIFGLDNAIITNNEIRTITKSYYKFITNDSISDIPTNKFEEKYEFDEKGYLTEYLIIRDSVKYIIKINYNSSQELKNISKQYFLNDSLYDEKILTNNEFLLTRNYQLDFQFKLNPFIDFSKKRIYPKSEDLFFGDHWKWIQKPADYYFIFLGQKIKIDTLSNAYPNSGFKSTQGVYLSICDSINWFRNESGNWEAGCIPKYSVKDKCECMPRYSARYNPNNQLDQESYSDYGKMYWRFIYEYDKIGLLKRGAFFRSNSKYMIKYKYAT